MALNCTPDGGSGEDARPVADSNLPVAGTDLTELSQVHHQQIARACERALMRLEDITARWASDARKWQKQVTESRQELKESEDKVTALQAQVEELQRDALQIGCDSKRAQTKAENRAAKLKKQIAENNQKIKKYEANLEEAALDCMHMQTDLDAAACSGTRMERIQADERERHAGELGEHRLREAALQTQVKKLEREAAEMQRKLDELQEKCKQKVKREAQAESLDSPKLKLRHAGQGIETKMDGMTAKMEAQTAVILRALKESQGAGRGGGDRRKEKKTRF